MTTSKDKMMSYEDIATQMIARLGSFNALAEKASKNELRRVLIAVTEYPVASTQYTEKSQLSDTEKNLLEEAVKLKEHFGALHVLALASAQQDEYGKTLTGV